MARRSPPSPEQGRIALVLQGGGALGAYQAGVFQALSERGLTPDWVVGTSIGAVNAALIAGNPPQRRLARLEDFWHRVACRDPVDMRLMPDPVRRANTWMVTCEAALLGIPGFFTPRPPNVMAAFAAGLPTEPEQASFYDTTELAQTLTELVDFEQLRAPRSKGAMRLTVSAMDVTSGELALFDSLHEPLGVHHIMASGALPPGFPPVRIDGRLFWDGGLYSNTPLDIVLDDLPRENTLCFMVELWRAHGPEPNTLEAVRTRTKDIQYASRSDRHIEEFRRLHELRNALRALHDCMPQPLRDSRQALELASHGCDTTMHVVRLPYGGHDWYMASKDLNFSSGSLQWRWQQGYRDAMRAADQAPWRAPHPPHVGVVVHDLAREESGENPTGAESTSSEGEHHENAA